MRGDRLKSPKAELEHTGVLAWKQPFAACGNLTARCLLVARRPVREASMAGVGGTSPKTPTQKVIWWIVAGLFGLFVIYVLIKNRHNF
jgi:hypothetical protein